MANKTTSLKNYSAIWQEMQSFGRMAKWGKELSKQEKEWFSPDCHGKMAQWLHAIEAIKPSKHQGYEIKEGKVVLDTMSAPDTIREGLKVLSPWRKGPFQIGEVFLDTEWRSDWKWQRLGQELVETFQDKRILDVGSGNGYYLFHMLAQGARLALGIDPFWLYCMQFQLIRKLAGEGLPAAVLPLGADALPMELRAFDVVFSMGVLYHRRDPLGHLAQLREVLLPDGQLVLETLIVEGGEHIAFVPQGRYAQMRNVWFLPSIPSLLRWLERVGFYDVEVIDVTTTTLAEQRRTEWMQFHSLENFLDPEDHTKTVEGHPAPRRALLRAKNK